MGINRNIVECKGLKTHQRNMEKLQGINRNIVECKGDGKTEAVSTKAVLIETLWNVKDYRLKRILDTQSINRNIVECKERVETADQQRSRGINRNIVECKDHQPIVEAFGAARINRNIVECKAVS